MTKPLWVQMQEQAAQDRQLDRVERNARWVRRAFTGGTGGQAKIATPLDQVGGGDADVVATLNPTVVHTATLTATPGQTLGAASEWTLSAVDDDPSGQIGFLTSVADGFPASGWQVDFTGVVLFDVEWRWGYLAAGSSAGRFRTAAEFTVTRTRGGTVESVAYSDVRVGPGGEFSHVAWSCEGGDVFSFATPHGSGSETLATGEVQVTAIKTGVPDLPAASTDSLWTIDIATSPVGIVQYTLAGTKVETTTTPLTNTPSGIEIVAGELWAFTYESGATYSLVRWTPGAGAFTSNVATSANFYKGMAWDGTGFWTWDQDASLVKRIGTDGSVQVTAPNSTGMDASFGGMAWDGTNAWMLGEVGGADRLFKLAADGTLDTAFALGVGVPAPGNSAGLAWDGTNLRYTNLDGTYFLVAIDRTGALVGSPVGVADTVIYIAAGA